MAIEQIETSAIIIGAGPAGAGTSFFLSKYGIPHIVIEKERFPRDKVCGDACSGKTVLVIKRANPDWADELLKSNPQFLPSWGVTFAAPNGKAIEIPFTTQRTEEMQAPGFTVTRLVFDEFLFRKMSSPYATIFEEAQVQDITITDGKVTVSMLFKDQEYHITAPVIVGADGDKGIVRRQFVNADESSKSSAVGLRAYYEGLSWSSDEPFIELHFLKETLPGYFWIFPLPNGMANVGVGIPSEVVRKKKIHLRAQMLDAIKNNPSIAPRFANATLKGKIQGWGLPMVQEHMPLSGSNFLLTGDAASLIDPFTGEGIGNALYSGMLAADAIKRCIEDNDYSATKLKEYYDGEIHKRLGDEFRISSTLQKLSRRRWLFNAVINKAHKSDVLRNTISSMFANIDLRDQLRKPSFYFRILFNK
jgi:geranylgeranyl reductase family protein